MSKPEIVSQEEAEVVALNALTFLASAPDRLTRFLQLTGLAPTDLHTGASSPQVQSAVLQHLMGNESELLVFAAEYRVPPETVSIALRRLNGSA